jgi:hypothetical protein
MLSTGAQGALGVLILSLSVVMFIITQISSLQQGLGLDYFLGLLEISMSLIGEYLIYLSLREGL